jgi:hypothetical protein
MPEPSERAAALEALLADARKLRAELSEEMKKLREIVARGAARAGQKRLGRRISKFSKKTYIQP